MKPISLDKSFALLLVIILVFAGTVGFLYLSLRSDEVERALKVDRVLNIAVILELDGKPVSTELFMFYPRAGTGAILDIPGETGVILKSLKRMDRIDAAYTPSRPASYIAEVAKFLDTAIDGYVVFDEKGLADAVDLMEGLELFIPSMVIQEGAGKVRLPGGAVTLDGQKLVQYARYREENESDADVVGRRHRLFQAMLKRLSGKGDMLRRRDVFPVFSATARSDLGQEARLKFLAEMGSLDAERLALQSVTGVYRTVDGQRLLFPHYDGELVRDIVKQTIAALSSSPGGPGGSSVRTVEILNGTSRKGLAATTAEIYQSFGYEVVSIGNSDLPPQERTIVLDRRGDKGTLENVAAVIRCDNVGEGQDRGNGVVADFTIILGKDFDGRYCGR